MAAVIAPGTPAAGQAAPATKGTSEGRNGASKTPESGSTPDGPAKDAKPAKTKEQEQAERNASAASRRDATIAKFAKRMNSEAEADGVEVEAPPEERRAKPGPKPGTPRKPKAAAETETAPAAPTAPKTPAEKIAARNALKTAPAPTDPEIEGDELEAENDAAAAPDEDADTGKPEPRATHQLKAKARLRHGDVDKAIKLAFGDMKPEEFESVKEGLARKLSVGSKDWADFRRFQKEERAKTKEFHERAVGFSRQLQTDFGPLIEAKKAYKSGDYPKALELAFGEDVNTFNRKAIHQHLSQDPEKVRMQQQIDELKARIEGGGKPDPQAQQREREVQHVAALNREANKAFAALSESDDPEIAHYATKKAFIRRVVELRGEHYDPQTHTTIPLRVAADMAREERKAELNEWRIPDASGAAAPSSELPGLAGNEPVRTSAPRARSPLPSQAAQAGGPTRSLSREERIRFYTQRMG